MHTENSFNSNWTVGHQAARITAVDFAQQNNVEFSGKLTFPITSDCDSFIAMCYGNAAYGDRLPENYITFVGAKYCVKKCTDITVAVKQSECITVSVGVSGVKSNTAQASDVSGASFLNPARLFTWNDAIAEVHNRAGCVIESSIVRSVMMHFGPDKTSGNIVHMGNSEIDLNDSFTVKMGYRIKRYGVFEDRKMMSIDAVKFTSRPVMDGEVECTSLSW